MDARDRLGELIDLHRNRLRDAVPPDREGAILALLRARDRLTGTPGSRSIPDLITGHRLPDPAGNEALRLCIEATGVEGTPAASPDELDAWANQFLQECEHIVNADMVLAHVDTGFMRLADQRDGSLTAWIASKRVPASWRERADFDWWASSLARRHEHALSDLRAETHDPADDTRYRHLARLHLEMMACQPGYPPDGVVGGLPFRMWLEILGHLIARALRERDLGHAGAPQSETALVAGIASGMEADPEAMREAVAAFTLDRENAAWHAAVPGVAAAPLVRVAPDRVVLSTYGLTTEPLLFLTRELRHREAEAYHNAASQREDAFRDDLYAIFTDKRFVTSSGRIRIRRAEGNLRTDIDAVVFDRKTGTLGTFELKSQDPFARSASALDRQRTNVLYANRQISGLLAWLQKHGGDDLLGRVDNRTAKRFRVHKVYPFVLGRYLVHFDDGDGPGPDRRAAWGTWPQVLRLLEEQPMLPTDANPIASLFNRLTQDGPPLQVDTDQPPRTIMLGETHLTIHPSYASLRAHQDDSTR